MTADPLELLVDALATYRITRLVTTDRIFRRRRVLVIRSSYVDQDGPDSDSALNAYSDAEWEARVHDDDDPPVGAAFIICPWCVGVWVALGVVIARRVSPRFWTPLARALAFSAATGWAGGRAR